MDSPQKILSLDDLDWSRTSKQKEGGRRNFKIPLYLTKICKSFFYRLTPNTHTHTTDILFVFLPKENHSIFLSTYLRIYSLLMDSSAKCDLNCVPHASYEWNSQTLYGFHQLIIQTIQNEHHPLRLLSSNFNLIKVLDTIITIEVKFNDMSSMWMTFVLNDLNYRQVGLMTEFCTSRIGENHVEDTPAILTFQSGWAYPNLSDLSTLHPNA